MPAMISGTRTPSRSRRAARSGSATSTPTAASAKPARMMLLGRRSPARFPASSATANMLSDSGASDRPACIALYSSTICRKIGSAIIEPPSAICCSICPVIPSRNSFDLNRSGSISVGLPARLRRTSHQASEPSANAPIAISTRDRLAAFLPHEDAEHDATHAHDRQHRADHVDSRGPGVRHVLDQPDAATARRR